MRLRSTVLVVSLGLAIPLVLIGGRDPASAAGPRAVRISGPCLEPALEVAFTPAGDVNVRDLAVALGAWFTTPAEDVIPLAEHPPPGDLGKSYAVDWVFRTEDDEVVVRQTLYPYAKGGAVVHTPPSQQVVPEAVGWYRAPPELYPLLFDLGLTRSIAESCSAGGDSEGRGNAAGIGVTVVASVATFIAGYWLGRRRALVHLGH